jgi:ATP/maltotriose-dependent transcriptional regulator MalT
MLFPDGPDQLPPLANISDQVWALTALALSYELSGRPGEAVKLFLRCIGLSVEQGDWESTYTCQINLANASRQTGDLRQAELAANQVRLGTPSWLTIFSLHHMGLIFALRGVTGKARELLEIGIRKTQSHADFASSVVFDAFYAQGMLWLGDALAARDKANRVWELAQLRNHERDFIRAAWLQGSAALELNDLDIAEERLHYALARARIVNHTERELQSLVALAELRRRQGDLKSARESLDDVWDAAERGPYPLFHADAFNVLAQIERDAGNHTAAVEAATKAYRLA